MSIKIVNKNGVGYLTKVYTDDGTEIKGISEIRITPINARGHIQVALTFENVELDIVANPTTATKEAIEEKSSHDDGKKEIEENKK